MSTRTNRAIAAAVAASIALTGLGLTSASAAPTAVGYRHRGDAAAIGAFAAIAGTIAAIAAARHDHDRYYDGGPYAYDYGPPPFVYDRWHRHWYRR